MGSLTPDLFTYTSSLSILCLFQWSITAHLGMIAASISVWVSSMALIVAVTKDTHSTMTWKPAQVSESNSLQLTMLFKI